MAEREDVVLVAIPLFALGGPVVARLVRFLEPMLPMGIRLAAVPFTTLGPLAALALIGYELLVRPPAEDRH